MDKKELINKYKEYYKELIDKATANGSSSKMGPRNDDTRNNYGSYLMALRFWAIDDILKNWFVAKKNKKYYETFDPNNTCEDKNGIVKASSEWNKGFYVECSERNYHLFNYYRTNIKNKNKLKEGKTQAYQSNLIIEYDYLQDISAFLSVNDMVHALTIIDIVLGIVQKAIDRYKYCKKESKKSKNDKNTIVTTHKNNFTKLNQSRRALAIMLEWIEFGKEKKDEKEYLIFTQNVIDNKDEGLNEKRLKMKELNLIHKIDGAIALVREIGIDNFIQYAIEQSYFFEPSIVTNQMGKIVDDFKKYKRGNSIDAELPARNSTKVIDSDESDEGSADDSIDNSSEVSIDTYDDDLSEKVYYHQYVDYIRTAKFYVKDAKDYALKVNSKKKVSEQENAAKAARTALILAQAAAKKAADTDVNAAVDEVRKAVESGEKAVYGENVPKNQLSEKKAEEKVDKSKFRLFHSSDLKKDYPIIIDSDGNKAVRVLIEDKTGYSVSKGKSSIFQNYKISHVWGRAYDPRYFTNLWNIVLVPAWANDLLDKNTVEKTLESKFKSTIMRICWVLYFDSSNNNSIDNKLWKILDMKDCPKNVNEEDIVSSTSEISNPDVIKTLNEPLATKNIKPYLINIIEGKRGKTLGDIVKYAVYI